MLSTAVTLERELALPKVRAALGKHTDPAFAGVLDAVALRTLEYRLLPLLEADVRLELKERADEEALRFLSQHLRQLLLTPPVGQRPLAGVDVNAKGDWTIALVDDDGALSGPVVRIEVGEKDARQPRGRARLALRPGPRTRRWPSPAPRQDRASRPAAACGPRSPRPASTCRCSPSTRPGSRATRAPRSRAASSPT